MLLNVPTSTTKIVVLQLEAIFSNMTTLITIRTNLHRSITATSSCFLEIRLHRGLVSHIGIGLGQNINSVWNLFLSFDFLEQGQGLIKGRKRLHGQNVRLNSFIASI
ncbi:hypothetical protein RND81_04G064400 [Saponaria officinalis]|uniref:Uncharacterized protein n=1 Tax=Saponaria officinalis TaxID=3572 RepID=A0AAW1LIF9_SAPOF